jgi:Tfp pilus assembly protein PilF
LTGHDTTNAESFQFYLRGRYFWNKRTADGIRKAVEQFQQAIERDPNYALGYVGLADCYVLLEINDIPTSEGLPRARAAADRALQIDDSLSEAHASSALVYDHLWRWSEAEEEYKRAISLNPNYATAHQWFAGFLRSKRQFDDALREIKRAQELDPLSSIIGINVASDYLLKNDPNSAIEQNNRIIELDPSFPRAHEHLGFAYLKQRRYEQATTEFQKTVELSGRGAIFLSDLGYCYAVTGKRAEALQILKELEEKYAKREAKAQYLASVYVGLGDKDQAFAWLEKDFEQHSDILPRITWWFSFEDLRSDPRYADLVRRMGLQP